MPDDLAVSADAIDGPEVVVFFRHFLGGTEQDSFCSFIAALVDRAERIVGGLLFLRKAWQSEKTQQKCGQKFSHWLSLFEWYVRVAENLDACLWTVNRRIYSHPERPLKNEQLFAWRSIESHQIGHVFIMAGTSPRTDW